MSFYLNLRIVREEGTHDNIQKAFIDIKLRPGWLGMNSRSSTSLHPSTFPIGEETLPSRTSAM